MGTCLNRSAQDVACSTDVWRRIAGVIEEPAVVDRNQSWTFRRWHDIVCSVDEIGPTDQAVDRRSRVAPPAVRQCSRKRELAGSRRALRPKAQDIRRNLDRVCTADRVKRPADCLPNPGAVSPQRTDIETDRETVGLRALPRSSWRSPIPHLAR
jgi:hypothetical protein